MAISGPSRKRLLLTRSESLGGVVWEKLSQLVGDLLTFFQHTAVLDAWQFGLVKENRK